MRSISLFGLTFTVCGGLAFASACGTTNPSGFGSLDGSTDASTNDEDPFVNFGDTGSEGIPSCTQCSGDLKSILTCGDNPTVVQTCTGDQGCGPNGCINACDAAAANKSSIGCDYYALPADGWNANYSSGGSPGNCFAAFVANNWNSPMKVSVVWKGPTLDATTFSYIPPGRGNAITYQPVPSTGIPTGKMAIVFLNQTNDAGGSFKVNCPAGVKAAIENEDMVIHSTSKGHAVELKTSVPAVVYDVYPYGGAASFISSATLLLPTTAWDTNYVSMTMSTYSSFPPGIDFVARENNTQVTVLPSNAIVGGTGVAAAAKGVATTYNLQQGELIHLTQTADLSGSIIQSNVPIGVWGEHFCMVQDQPPKWSILGAVDGTTLTYDPAVPAGPKALARGQRIDFDGPTSFRIKSQDDKHPFYLMGHRPGYDCDAAHQQIPPVKALGSEYVAVGNESANYNIGGPESVSVIPPQQFLKDYIFFTDPTYGWTEVSLTRGKASDNTYKDVTLDCLGTVTGWTPIGASGYQSAHAFLQQNHAAVGGCNNGLHNIKSDSPFGITVWGYDSASSYAYPAGASVKPINTVVVPPIPN
ncbi:hypothetical protein BH09MYX1_BH09MYX1_29950 [soil metagenome]